MTSKNTVLIIEPRLLIHLINVINEYYKVLGDKWIYVFYCAKNKSSYWKDKLCNLNIEIRELEFNNFNSPSEYSDFVKSRSLWESLYGDFVLTVQVDTWILNLEPYNIDYFINLNKSFIGGNMFYQWPQLARENINFPIKNFNGGLSLRKRLDMIKIIDMYPPLPTSKICRQSIQMETDAEDVYFIIGCFRLRFDFGNDEESSNFCVHTIFKENFFGIHCLDHSVKDNINKKFPQLKLLNPSLNL